MSWVVANANLALVKYWGKADEVTRQPAGSSLSLTLDGLTSAALGTICGLGTDGYRFAIDFALKKR